MTWLIWLALAGWSGIAAVWAALLGAQWRARRLGMLPDPHADAAHAGASSYDGEDWPSVCVIVPVRNAPVALETCVTAILCQDYPNLSVIIVDDRSEDDTGAVAARFAREDRRVSVQRIDALPPGWLGKSHALWRAAEEADATWLLFVDDDCILEPAAVSATMREALAREVQLLTLWPRHVGRTFWEHMLIPLCGGIIALWFNPQRVVSDDSPVAFANGQFILIERRMYDRIDGHRRVRRALIEDIPLAEAVKAAGGRCWVALGRDLATVRMYSRLSQVNRGWLRIYVGALRSGTRILASVAWLVFGSLLPCLATPVLAWRLLTGPSSPPALVAAGGIAAVHLALLLIVSYRFWGMGGCNRWYLWLYPVSVGGVIGILLRAWWWLIVRRSITWRDTRYQIDRSARLDI